MQDVLTSCISLSLILISLIFRFSFSPIMLSSYRLPAFLMDRVGLFWYARFLRCDTN
jgi:hypothetical protein